MTDLTAAPSNCSALGILTGLHRLWLSTGVFTNNINTLLPALSQLHALRRLGFWSREPDLAPLEQLSELQGLTLGLHPDADLSVITCLHQLTFLQLFESSVVQRRQLSAMTGLCELRLLQVAGDRDPSYLVAMGALTKLAIGLDNLRVNWTGIGCMRSLRTLCLSKVHRDMDFRPLAGVTALRSLTIAGTATVSGQDMGRQRQLIALRIEVPAILDPMHLSHLTALGDLYLACQSMSVFGWLSQITNLRMLCLHTPMLRGLAPLSSLSRLESLSLMGQMMTSLHDLNGLSLRALSLTGCLQLMGVSNLHHIRQLQALSLINCARWATFGLSALTTLTYLSIDTTPLIYPLPLIIMTNLRLFDVRGTSFAIPANILRAQYPWLEIRQS